MQVQEYLINSPSLTKNSTLVNDIGSEAANHTIRGNLLLKQINVVIDPAIHQALSKYFIWSIDTISVKTIENLNANNIESLENKRSEIKEMLNMIVVQQRNLRRNLETTWKEAEELAIELIKDLKKEYHIK